MGHKLFLCVFPSKPLPLVFVVRSRAQGRGKGNKESISGNCSDLSGNEERKAVRRKRHLGLTLKEIGMVLQQEEIT